MKRFARIAACLAAAVLLWSGGVGRAEVCFKPGAALRWRHEYWRNVRDMDDDARDNRNYFRLRTSVWGELDVDEAVTLFLKLTNENKAYAYFAGTSSSAADKTASKKGYHYDIHEVIFDNLYVAFAQLPAGLELVVGRQDLCGLYGEGFLVYDGTPEDGSRTHYFNAARLCWHADEKNRLNLVYANNPRDEEFLPALNESKLVRASDPTRDKVVSPLNRTDEQGAFLIWQNTTFDPLYLEPYFMFKREDEQGGAGLQARRSRIYTHGAFARYKEGATTLRGQFAWQLGDYGSASRHGLGGYFFIDRTFGAEDRPHEASLGFIYLSGDDRSTARQEAWDPLFSRYPWISNLLSQQAGNETGVGYYWTNLEIGRLGLQLCLTEKTSLDLAYNYLRAEEQVAPSAVYSGNGMEKGHLVQGQITHKLTKNVKTYFMAEVLFPGDFYQNKDKAFFLRTHVEIAF